MTTLETISSLVAAIGTVAVAILAIWGDWVRSHLAPAKLTIEPHNVEGNLTTFTDSSGIINTQSQRVYFYHLKVVNKRRWIRPRNCRVLLKAMSKRGSDGTFQPIQMPVPLQYVWAPAEITPPVIDVDDVHILDFGAIPEANRIFKPALYSFSNNFAGCVNKNEVIRYSLQIVSDIFISDKYQVFEVAWDGEWDQSQVIMQTHLRIREITPDQV